MRNINRQSALYAHKYISLRKIRLGVCARHRVQYRYTRGSRSHGVGILKRQRN